MRIYATAMALACMIHLGSITTANANNTRITLSPQHPFSGGSGEMNISVPVGQKTEVGKMYLHWGCNLGERVGDVNYKDFPGNTQYVYLSAVTGGTFNDSQTLFPTTSQPQTPRSWDYLGDASKELGYDLSPGSSGARIFVRDAKGYSTQECSNGINLWLQLQNKPAGVCVDNTLCSYRGVVNKLVGIAPSRGPSGQAIELVYPEKIQLESGKTTQLLAVRPVQNSYLKLTLTFNATPNIVPLTELTDNNGNKIAMGTAIQTNGYGMEVNITGLGVPTPGTTSGEITITAQSV